MNMFAIFSVTIQKTTIKIVPKDFAAGKNVVFLFSLQDVYSQEITENVPQWKDSIKSSGKIFTKYLFSYVWFKQLVFQMSNYSLDAIYALL